MIKRVIVVCDRCMGDKEVKNVRISTGGTIEVELECGHWNYFHIEKFLHCGHQLKVSEIVGLETEKVHLS